MKNKKRWSKIRLMLMIAFSCMAVPIAGISTYAWFQASQTVYDGGSTINSGNTSLTIGDTYGYKSVRQKGSDGTLQIEGSNVTKKKVSDEVITNNTDMGEPDKVLDVPSGGVGYYMIPKVGDNFFFRNSGTVKLAEYPGANMAKGSFTFPSGTTVLRFKKYTFEGTNPIVTANAKIDVTDSNIGTFADQDLHVTVGSSTTYTVWFNHSTGVVSLEESFTTAGKNIASRATYKTGFKEDSADYTSSKTKIGPTRHDRIAIESGKMYFIVPTSLFSGWGTISDYKCLISGGSELTMSYDSDNSSYWCELPSNKSGFYFRFKENSTQQWQADNDGSWNPYPYTFAAGHILTATGLNWLGEGDGTKHDQLVCTETTEINGSSTKTVYLYDPGQTISTNNGTAPKAYAFKDGTYNDKNAAWPGVNMSRVRDFYWSVSVSTTLTGIIFTNSDGSIQTGNLATPTGTSCAYDYSTGSWYNPASTTSDSYTYYLYDPGNYYNGAAYVKYWCNKYDDAAAGPISMTPQGTTRLWYITINAHYDHLLFCKDTSYTSQTADLVIPQTNKYYVLSSAGTGEWKNLSAAGSNQTIRLYDPNNLLSNANSKPRVYAYESTISHYPTKNADEPGIEMTKDSRSDGKLWYANISSSFNKVVFENNAGTVKTGAKDVGAKKIFVAKSVSSNTVSGDWYSSIASESTKTYYYYDNRANGWNSPHAYLWENDSITGETDLYNVYPNRVSSWPGPLMEAYSTWSAADKETFDGLYPGADTAHIFRITASETYNRIIFNSGGSNVAANQTPTEDIGTTNHNGEIFVLDGGTNAAGNSTGSWGSAVYGITLKASYFINNSKSSFASTTLETEYSFGTTNYTPAFVTTDPLTKVDDNNGILYAFNRVGTKWYTDESCEAQYEYTATTLSATTTLFAKYNVSLSDLTTFHVYSSSWNDIKVYNQGASGSLLFHSSSHSFKIADKLFRITLPNNWLFRIGDYNSSSRTSTDSDMSDGTVDSLLYCSGTTPSWIDQKTTTLGTATIYVDGVGVKTMAIGDIYKSGDKTEASHNFFIFEEGIEINQGSNLYVSVALASGVTSDHITTKNLLYDDLTSGDKAKTFMSKITSGSAAGRIKFESNDGNDKGRYTLYVTKSGELSIASVPIQGNGFFIMPYNGSTTGFTGARQMITQSETRATYDGWIATADAQSEVQSLYIRSYMNAVDKHYTSLETSFTNGEATMESGVLRLKPGRYNIEVNNNTIYVTGFVMDEFFCLDPLKSGVSIKNNYTSIVLEIEFSMVNSMPVKPKLEVRGLPSYLAVSFYVAANGAKLVDGNGDSTAYSSMRENTIYSTRQNPDGAEFEITSSTSLAADTVGSTKYYAYILIDYKDGVTSIPSNPAAKARFYLKTVQA